MNLQNVLKDWLKEIAKQNPELVSALVADLTVLPITVSGYFNFPVQRISSYNLMYFKLNEAIILNER